MREIIKNAEDAVLLQELVAALSKSDRAAWEQLYILHYTSLGNFIGTIIRTEHYVEDIINDVFITLWENRDKISSEKSVRGFIYTVARNHALAGAVKKAERRYRLTQGTTRFRLCTRRDPDRGRVEDTVSAHHRRNAAQTTGSL